MALWTPMSALMKAAFQACARAYEGGGGHTQADRVRQVLERARRELEKL